MIWSPNYVPMQFVMFVVFKCRDVTLRHNMAELLLIF